MKKILILTLLSFAALCSCKARGPSGVADSIPDVSDKLGSAKSRVESADKLIVRAKPESNATGRALIAAAHEQHDGALSDLADAKRNLEAASRERDKLEEMYAAEQAAREKLEHSWGHRLEVLVTRLIWLIVGLFVFHLIGGLVGPLIGGPIGAGISLAARFINPMAWGQGLIDKLHSARLAPSPAGA